MDDDVEAVPRAVPWRAAYHGHDGVRRWWKNLLDVLPDYSVEVVEVRDVGDLTVAACAFAATARVATFRWSRRSGSGPVAAREVRLVAQLPHAAEALEAVGLSEQDAHADS